MKQVHVKAKTKTPVVLIIFDEFAPVALMDSRERVDASALPELRAARPHLDLVPQRDDGAVAERDRRARR